MMVLASASPRRKQLLQQLAYQFEVHSADIDESVAEAEEASVYLLRMATTKAEAVSACRGNTDELILAADTSVVLGQQILGKPESAKHAKQMLTALSGQWHEVKTSVALMSCGHLLDVWVETTAVQFVDLQPSQIHAYIAGGEPFDKAGAYAIQGFGGSFVRQINGCFYNVVGLPLAAVAQHISPYSALL